MKHRHNSGAGFSTGAVDVFDLCLGIGLAAVLPLAVWLILQLLGVETKTEEDYYRQYSNPRYASDLPPLPPDGEVVNLRLDHCRQILSRNVRVYLERYRKTEGGDLKKFEKEWARESLSKLRAELSDLQASIRNSRSEDLFSAQLGDIDRMLAEVENGMKETS